MALHIFTVNEKTFKVHLNYMFAGTGKEGQEHQTGALADISGVRENDLICFYVMNKDFYGVFKAKGRAFYEPLEDQYLNLELGKNLTYRIFIEPYKVFQNCKSEWDVMENPSYIKERSVYNMQWGWIFKKLNANRGCLSIDKFEAELLQNIIALDNNLLSDVSKNYDFVNNKIINYSDTLYNGDTTLPLRNNKKISIEEDLRIHFTSKTNGCAILNKILKPEIYGNINFISNEVICSFSERKMDLVLGTDNNYCLLIELKNSFKFDESIYNQLKEYSRWMSAYKSFYKKIIPILIMREAPLISKRKNSQKFKFMSKEDEQNDIVSVWYKDIMEKINSAKARLQAENIPRLEPLQIFIFTTDDNSELENFKEI